MAEIEDIVRRLAAIQDSLLALDRGASPERFRLLQERDALRDMAVQFAPDADAGRSTTELQAELASWKRRRKTILDRSTGYVFGDSADSAGRVGAAFVEARGESGPGALLDEANRRIARIEELLAEREPEST